MLPSRRPDEVVVHLVRHGQSEWNVQGRLQGQSPAPGLTPLGREQARSAAELLARRVNGPVALVSSDLTRARETAETVAARLGVATRIDRGLREQGLGTLEGRLTRELRPEPTPDGVDVGDVRWGGGESLRDVHERVCDLLHRLLPTAPQHLVLISHGDTIRVLRAALAGSDHHALDWSTAIGNGWVRSVAVGRSAWSARS
ncbi:histidine phosphatase family protein [Pedococcus sp. NPDC057267]|uniref:histidine phosphatase family protein n=1 Tax=Pedococcus sp. NPDC057267 TaxID=3346077 RepID=UPI0036380F06